MHTFAIRRFALYSHIGITFMHIPVLQKEVLDYLSPKPNENFVDCTLGLAGHTQLILERTKPNGKVLGIELDANLCQEDAKKAKKMGERLIVANDSYVNLKEIIKKQNFHGIAGILYDLGMSSWHVDESARGFTFQKDEFLDMRFGKEGLTAEEIVNKLPLAEIEKILKDYGQERFAKQIAKAIISARKAKQIKTTFQLKEIIKKATPRSYNSKRINSATKTFQALRIAVNDELNNLKQSLIQALDILEKDGRIAVISFHSSEDGMVKKIFKEAEKNGFLKLLTKKPIIPTQQEVRLNRRARSAKLRAAVKLTI